MATQLTVVNNVLRRLREDTVNSVADNDYSQLIAQFVNDAKADIEDYNHEWSVYVSEQDITMLADGATRIYNLSSTNNRSWLMRDPAHDRLPMAFDVTEDKVQRLHEWSYKQLKSRRARTEDAATETDDHPSVFCLTTDGSTWSMEFLWALDSSQSARTMRSYWYVPQAELSLTGSDDATVIQLPSRAIELRALFYALNERGEEMGTFGGIADRRSTDAIAAAMEIDAAVQKKTDEIEITNSENL